MKSNKLRVYLIGGMLLGFFGLADLPTFDPMYHGIAVAASVMAFVMAGVEYRRNKTKE